MLHQRPVVFVVDDDVSVRESLEMLIQVGGWRPEIFDSPQQFLLSERLPIPNCLVLDVNLPDISGIELQQLVSADRPEMPIIFVTGYGDVPTTVRAMKGGAVEFLTKPFSDDVLLDAIEKALERSSSTLAAAAELQALRERHASLSQREQQVMGLVVSGLLNKQVAYELGISEVTVKAHRGQVMRKMWARSLPDLVNMAARLQTNQAEVSTMLLGVRSNGVRTRAVAASS